MDSKKKISPPQTPVPMGKGIRKYTNPKDLENTIQTYFEQMRAEKRPLTITGLCIAVGFKSRQTLLDYEEKEQYGHLIREAKMRCQNYAEELLFQNRNVYGVIFNLTNNYGWRNRMDVVTEGKYDKRLADDIRSMTSDDVDKRFKKLSKGIKKEIRDKRKEGDTAGDIPSSTPIEPQKDTTPERVIRDNMLLKRGQDVAKGR